MATIVQRLQDEIEYLTALGQGAKSKLKKQQVVDDSGLLSSPQLAAQHQQKMWSTIEEAKKYEFAVGVLKTLQKEFAAIPASA